MRRSFGRTLRSTSWIFVTHSMFLMGGRCLPIRHGAATKRGSSASANSKSEWSRLSGWTAIVCGGLFR